MDEIRRIADTATVMRDGRVIDTVSVADTSTPEIISMMLGSATGHSSELRDVASTERVSPAVPQVPEKRDAEEAKVLVKVEDLVLAPKLDGVSLELRAGEVLGLAGVLGSGRSELLRCIAGLERVDQGSVAVDGRLVKRPSHQRMFRLGVGITPENRSAEGVFPAQGVDENMVITDWSSVARMGFVVPSRRSAAAGRLADALSIKCSSVADPISSLSGGNQQKAVIGRWLHARSRILLLDEPTRGVDVEAKEQIYELIANLAAEGKGIIFVSSELEELPEVCTRIVVLRDGKVAQELPGDVAVHVLIDAAMASEVVRT
jgi:simple sugar transport system ATP-binding protein